MCRVSLILPAIYVGEVILFKTSNWYQLINWTSIILIPNLFILRPGHRKLDTQFLDRCRATESTSRTLTRCSWRWPDGRRSSAGCSSEFRPGTRTPDTSRAHRRGTCRSPSGGTSRSRFDRFGSPCAPKQPEPGPWSTTSEAGTRGRVGGHRRDSNLWH